MTSPSLVIVAVIGALALAACAVPAAEPGRTTPAATDAPPTSAPAASAVASATPSASPSAAPVTAGVPSEPALVLRSGAGTENDSFITIDSATGRVMARTPIGVPDAAWSVVYVVASSAGRTTISAVEPRSGATLRETTIDGQYDLTWVAPGDLPTGLTPDGQTLVLVDRAPAAGHTRFVILDTAFKDPPREVDLAGEFEFDAIGPDGHFLFLIEHIGKAGSGHYQVRAFDLMVGRLVEGTIVDKRDVNEQMNGRPVARTSAPGGRTVSTLYIKDDGEAFVHQLDTVDGFALCIDLPDELRATTTEQADAWRIASAGDRAYVLNPSLGAALSIFEGSVLLAGSMPTSGMFGLVGAVVDPESGTIYVADSNGLAVLPTSSMRTVGAVLAGVGNGGIVAASGNRLFALDAAGSALVELSTSGPAPAAVRRIELPKLGGGSPGSLRLVGVAAD